MEKRTLLAVAICIGILVVWWEVFPPTPSAPPPAKPAATAPAGSGTTVAAGATPAAAPAQGTPAAAAAPTGPESRVELESEGARYVLSSWGGSLRQVVLKEERFLNDAKDPKSGLQIIGTTTAETAPLRTSFAKVSVAAPPGAYQVVRSSPTEVVFRSENE